MQALSITPQDLDAQIRHWLNTPAGAYLGSPYGHNIRSKLQRPMANTGMDEVIAKLLHDVPILALLPAGSVNLYELQGERIDATTLVIEVSGRVIEVPRD